MHSYKNPETIAPPPPRGRFSHYVEVQPNLRWVYISGQSGVKPDGSIDPDLGGQARETFANIKAILDDAGMTVADLVKINIYFMDAPGRAELGEARNAFLGDYQPAATMVKVAGLAVDGWLVEVEAIAAAPMR